MPCTYGCTRTWTAYRPPPIWPRRSATPIGHWPGLVVFLDDGRVEMDTNVVGSPYRDRLQPAPELHPANRPDRVSMPGLCPSHRPTVTAGQLTVKKAEPTHPHTGLIILYGERDLSSAIANAGRTRRSHVWFCIGKSAAMRSSGPGAQRPRIVNELVTDLQDTATRSEWSPGKKPHARKQSSLSQSGGSSVRFGQPPDYPRRRGRGRRPAS